MLLKQNKNCIKFVHLSFIKSVYIWLTVMLEMLDNTLKITNNSKPPNLTAIKTNLIVIKEWLPLSIVFISAYNLSLWNWYES